MRIKLREYKTTDREQLEQLFYNTVHIVNAKDYTERTGSRYDKNCVVNK